MNKPVVNLSGAMTLTMKKLGMLNDPNLKALSSYFINDKEAHDLKVDLLLGGVFLSPKTIEKYKNNFFIIDQSLELKKQLQTKNVSSLVLDTRDLDPIEVIELTYKSLKKVSVGCQKRYQRIKKEIASKLNDIKNVNWKRQKLVFFLGSIKNKLPTKTMVNDGFVKYLKNNLGLQTYPTDAAYSGWSQKKLTLLQNNGAKLVGLVATGENMLFTKISEKRWNAKGRYILIPGFGQFDFMHSLSQEIKNKKL